MINRRQGFFYIKNNNKYVQLRFSQIIFGEARGNFVLLKLVGKCKTCLTPIGMKELSKALPGDLFCRVHRSYVVAIEKIKEFNGEKMVLADGTVLPVGRCYLGDLKERITIIGRKYVNDRWRIAV